MNINNFFSLNFTDAQIVEVSGISGTTNLKFIDWQEITRSVKFLDVIGFVAYSPENQDIGKVEALRDSERIKIALKASESEPSGTEICFRFYSAWNDLLILEVIASNIEC